MVPVTIGWDPTSYLLTSPPSVDSIKLIASFSLIIVVAGCYIYINMWIQPDGSVLVFCVYLLTVAFLSTVLSSWLSFVGSREDMNSLESSCYTFPKEKIRDLEQEHLQQRRGSLRIHRNTDCSWYPPLKEATKTGRKWLKLRLRDNCRLQRNIRNQEKTTKYFQTMWLNRFQVSFSSPCLKRIFLLTHRRPSVFSHT